MTMRTLYLLLCGICYAAGCKEKPTFKDAGPLVETNIGKVVGKYVKVFDTDVAAFLGIPYAKPPLGERRFIKSEPIEPWDGLLLANEKPPPCMQYSSKSFGWIPTSKPSEDCLYLNVWTPTKCCCGSQDKLPVLVWIHGGAFTVGSTDMDVYDGSIIASYGEVIVVSMNYRVGIFGFLNGGTAEAPGNAGLHDQTLALKWIQENIQHFNGDPDRITVFGESAGSMSISLHLISPLSRNLFHRAIMQSGSMYHPQMSDASEVAYYKATEFAKIIGCANETSHPEEIIQCFKEKDGMALSKAEEVFTSKGAVYFLPSYGNEFLPTSPIQVFESGDIAQIDVLMGTVKDEATIFLAFMMPDVFLLDQEVKLTLTQARDITRALFQAAPEPMVDRVISYYFQNTTEDSESVIEPLANAFGDFYFNCPGMFLAEKLDNAYVFWLTHRSLRDGNADWVGVHHFYEVPYVFGMPIIDSEHFTPEDGRFSGDLIQKWVTFARQGYPLPDDSKLSWPKFSSDDPVVFELNPRTAKTMPFPKLDVCNELWRPLMAPNTPSPSHTSSVKA